MHTVPVFLVFNLTRDITFAHIVGLFAVNILLYAFVLWLLRDE